MYLFPTQLELQEVLQKRFVKSITRVLLLAMSCSCSSCIYIFNKRTCFTCGFSKVLEELLVEDEGYSTDLFHLCFCSRIAVNEVCCDSDSQFAPELLPPEP